MRGRKPKPTRLKLLTGNPGKRKLNEREPTPPVEIPDCPEHLTDAAKVEWNRLTKELTALGILARVDRAALAAYCMAWARLVKAEGRIKKSGEILQSPQGPIRNPWLTVANKAVEQLQKIGSEFGLTPVSRSRISLGSGVAPTDKEARFFG